MEIMTDRWPNRPTNRLTDTDRRRHREVTFPIVANELRNIGNMRIFELGIHAVGAIQYKYMFLFFLLRNN